jgi:hypothetical protein
MAEADKTKACNAVIRSAMAVSQWMCCFFFIISIAFYKRSNGFIKMTAMRSRYHRRRDELQYCRCSQNHHPQSTAVEARVLLVSKAIIVPVGSVFRTTAGAKKSRQHDERHCQRGVIDQLKTPMAV